jgi:Mn2+/Fe2+ NRAMP family transporter
MKFLESYPPPPLTPGEIGGVVLFFVVLLVLFLLRKIPIFAAIWKLLMVFFVVLFGTLLWGSIKEGLKDDVKDFLK